MKAHMSRVAELGCIACRLLGYEASPAQVHHLTLGRGKGQKNSDMLTIPLCEPHHTGTHGIHGDRAFLRQLNTTELDLLAETLARLYGR